MPRARLKLELTVPFWASVDESGAILGLAPALDAKQLTEAATRAYAPDTLAARVQRLTGPKIDQNLVRVVSGFHDEVLRYYTFLRQTLHHYVMQHEQEPPEKFSRRNGRELHGSSLGGRRIHSDDLNELRVQAGAKALLGMPGIAKQRVRKNGGA
jgi:hypothetical protein